MCVCVCVRVSVCVCVCVCWVEVQSLEWICREPAVPKLSDRSRTDHRGGGRRGWESAKEREGRELGRGRRGEEKEGVK